MFSHKPADLPYPLDDICEDCTKRLGKKAYYNLGAAPHWPSSATGNSSYTADAQPFTAYSSTAPHRFLSANHHTSTTDNLLTRDHQTSTSFRRHEKHCSPNTSSSFSFAGTRGHFSSGLNQYPPTKIHQAATTTPVSRNRNLLPHSSHATSTRNYSSSPSSSWFTANQRSAPSARYTHFLPSSIY